MLFVWMNYVTPWHVWRHTWRQRNDMSSTSQCRHEEDMCANEHPKNGCCIFKGSRDIQQTLTLVVRCNWSQFIYTRLHNWDLGVASQYMGSLGWLLKKAKSYRCCQILVQGQISKVGLWSWLGHAILLIYRWIERGVGLWLDELIVSK